MKKFYALLLTLALGLMLTACAGKPAPTPSPTEAPVATDALEILNSVWNAYGDEEKFAAMGGDYEHTVMDAPGSFVVLNAEDLDSMLGLPQASAGLVDGAASLQFMMNANTFTAGSLHVADAANQKAVGDALRENILGRQWMCGFPDTLVVVNVGKDYVVSAFGNAEMIETFKTKLLAQYGGKASLAYEENLVF